MELEDFDISPDMGFLPRRSPPPLSADCFREWERLLAHLPRLLETKALRSEVDSLPEADFSDTTLKCEEEWRRAYVLLCFLGQAYIWMEGQAGLVDKVPRKLAVPWVAVSEKIGLKPVITYAGGVLYNFQFIDPSGPRDISNMRTPQSFTGREDESWFFVVHCCVEMAAGRGLEAVVRSYGCMANGDHASLCQCLDNVRNSIKDMSRMTSRMYEKCDPAFFFVTLRPYLAGSKQLDAFPDGLLYEGVDSEPGTRRQYNGGSGAQSSSLYAFDAFLGKKHSSRETHDYVVAMREYMPSKHRDFLERLLAMPSVREHCRTAGNPELVTHYNGAVDALVAFRNEHIVLVTRYVVNQVRLKSGNPTLDRKGTGGTEFNFLKRVRDDTEALRIAL